MFAARFVAGAVLSVKLDFTAGGVLQTGAEQVIDTFDLLKLDFVAGAVL